MLEAFKQAVGVDVTVLDVAGGFGHMRRAMDSSVIYRGIDINKTFIAYAQKRGTDMRYGDIFYPSAYESSDVVVMSDVLHHIPRDKWPDLLRLTLSSAQQRLVILEPAFLGVSNRNRMFGPLVDWLFKKLDNDGTGEVETWYTKDEYVAMLEGGLGLKEADEFSFSCEDVFPYLLITYSRK